jgi:hypothetical protein
MDSSFEGKNCKKYPFPHLRSASMEKHTNGLRTRLSQNKKGTRSNAVMKLRSQTQTIRTSVLHSVQVDRVVIHIYPSTSAIYNINAMKEMPEFTPPFDSKLPAPSRTDEHHGNEWTTQDVYDEDIALT